MTDFRRCSKFYHGLRIFSLSKTTKSSTGWEECWCAPMWQAWVWTLRALYWECLLVFVFIHGLADKWQIVRSYMGVFWLCSMADPVIQTVKNQVEAELTENHTNLIFAKKDQSYLVWIISHTGWWGCRRLQSLRAGLLLQWRRIDGEQASQRRLTSSMLQIILHKSKTAASLSLRSWTIIASWKVNSDAWLLMRFTCLLNLIQPYFLNLTTLHLASNRSCKNQMASGASLWETGQRCFSACSFHHCAWEEGFTPR